jgi:hypothetical protein
MLLLLYVAVECSKQLLNRNISALHDSSTITQENDAQRLEAMEQEGGDHTSTFLVSDDDQQCLTRTRQDNDQEELLLEEQV